MVTEEIHNKPLQQIKKIIKNLFLTQ